MSSPKAIIIEVQWSDVKNLGDVSQLELFQKD